LKKIIKSKKNEKDFVMISDPSSIQENAQKLFKAADALRKNIDAAEYKHPVLGLIFLKYISDSFDERHSELIKQKDKGADPEEKSEYRAENVFWVPEEARWSKIKDSAKKPEIGTIIDNAMIAIERENDESLKGVLPKNYASQRLDKSSLGSLVDLFSNIHLGGKENQTRDVLGRIYEYFLAGFASKEGKNAGQFYTPYSVVRLLVEMVQPTKGRLYEPCCGSGGMIVQSDRFIEKNDGELSFFGQESNQTTWRLCKMNLAIRGIDSDIRWNNEGTFVRDEHKSLKADYVLANPPFNDSDWSGEKLREDPRWEHGIPPISNANYAWIQNFIFHLNSKGIAGFVIAKGALSSKEDTEEYHIRKSLIEDDLIECVVNLPNKLFFSTQISPCLWFINKDKKENRKNQTLFIDARKLGVLPPGVKNHREFLEEEIRFITNIYHSWKGKKTSEEYHDIKGTCCSINKEEIRNHKYGLVPGRYTGTEELIDDDEEFIPKMTSLIEQLKKEFTNSQKLEKEIVKELGGTLDDETHN
jgi:type I restriction enzyme M protein